MSTYLDDVFGPSGLLSLRFPGYSPRPGQVAMARTIDASIEKRGHALVEAPTGTGKSVSYLVPAIYHVTHPRPRSAPPAPPPPADFDQEAYEEADDSPETDRSRAVIVTANIALQEQLVKKDLPMLQEVLPWKFTYGLLKGMSNFVCKERLEEDRDCQRVDEKMNAQIRTWAEETQTGDKSELPFEPPSRLWSNFSVSADECSGKECSYYKECWPKLARKRAGEADVVVTNYALFFLDIVVRIKSLGNASVLPDYNITVLDEGHKASSIARDFFGWRVSPAAIDWAASMLPTDDKIAMHRAQSKFFYALGEYRKSKKYKARIKEPNAVPSDELLACLNQAVSTYAASLGIQGEEELTREQKKARKKMKRKLSRCVEISLQIKDAMRVYAQPEPPWVQHPTASNFDNPDSTPYTRWYFSDPVLGGDNSVKSEAQLLATKPIKNIFFIEEESSRVVLSSMPVSVAETLRGALFGIVDSISVTSATLMANNSFDFIRDDLGIVEPSKPPVQTLVAESPFAWNSQALLVLPQDLPEPNSPNFTTSAVACLASVVDQARGRTLGLFTSYKNMNAAYEHLKRQNTYRVLKQGDLPRTQLIEEFRRDTHSVLLGVESFWAGVDVQGESLSCVFIDKLPFATPDDPLLDALAERDKHGWFMKYSVPQAIISLKQGFGRLIRTTTDKGVVVLCDRRVSTKGYGPLFLNALPPVPQSFDLQDVRRFLEGEPLRGLRRAPTGRSLFDELRERS